MGRSATPPYGCEGSVHPALWASVDCLTARLAAALRQLQWTAQRVLSSPAKIGFEQKHIDDDQLLSRQSDAIPRRITSCSLIRCGPGKGLIS